MMRRIVKIDQKKCNGCGLCADACHEAAIGMRDGRAILLKDDYCDGLGDCLPVCPTGAITFEEREAAAYDEMSVKARTSQWPVQLKLVPVKAPYYEYNDLLIAADCGAHTYTGFHEQFRRRKALVIGCPKLDGEDYSGKLEEILKVNEITSITVVRMEVPCCGGIEWAARKALDQSGKNIPLEVVTITTTGAILQI